MQCVTAVDPWWLAELGPMFFSLKESYNDWVVDNGLSNKDKTLMMEEEMKLEMQWWTEEIKKKQESMRWTELWKSEIHYAGKEKRMATPRVTRNLD